MNDSKTSAAMPELPATADAQDPLPEADWTWRRAFTYALTLICCGGVGWGLYTLHGLQAAEEIFYLSRWMLAIIGLLATYYLLAPSAEQMTRMIQAARLLRAGVTTSSRSTVQTPQGSAESVTTAGRAPVAPVAPAVPEDDEDAAPRSRT